MKTILLCFLMLFALAVPVFATSSTPDIGPPIGVVDLLFDLSTIAGAAAAVLLITGWVKTAFKLEGKFARWVSWIVAISLSFLGWLLNLGLFEPVTWVVAIIYGFGIGLVANGIFTSETVQYILSLFKAQVLKE